MSNIAESVYLAQGSYVLGDVTIGEDSSVWFNSVVRGDIDRIVIGAGTNIQDLSVVHTSKGFICSIGNYVSVGHGSVIHGCTIGDNTIVGMGSVIMNGAVVGENCIIGAGSVIPPGKRIPAGSVAVGNPARVTRTLTEKDIRHNMDNALRYVKLAADAKMRENDVC